MQSCQAIKRDGTEKISNVSQAVSASIFKKHVKRDFESSTASRSGPFRAHNHILNLLYDRYGFCCLNGFPSDRGRGFPCHLHLLPYKYSHTILHVGPHKTYMTPISSRFVKNESKSFWRCCDTMCTPQTSIHFVRQTLSAILLSIG